MLKLMISFVRAVFRWIKRSILVIGCVFFLTMGVLSLTSGTIQAALSTALGYLGVSTVMDVMQSRIARSQQKHNLAKKRNVEISNKNKNLAKQNKTLAHSLEGEKANGKRLTNSLNDERAKTKKLTSDLDLNARKTKQLTSANKSLYASNQRATNSIRGQQAAVKKLGGRVTSRTLKAAALNVGSIPAESIPWFGAAVIVTVTAAELHLACENINDMDELYGAMQIDVAEDQGMAVETCVSYIDKVENLLD